MEGISISGVAPERSAGSFGDLWPFRGLNEAEDLLDIFEDEVEGHISPDGRNGIHLQLRRMERKDNRQGVVHARIAVDDHLLCFHRLLSPKVHYTRREFAVDKKIS
jgi:hypothetical protein